MAEPAAAEIEELRSKIAALQVWGAIGGASASLGTPMHRGEPPLAAAAPPGAQRPSERSSAGSAVRRALLLLLAPPAEPLPA